MRWSCCRMPELEAGGCTELCDLCGQVSIIYIIKFIMSFMSCIDDVKKFVKIVCNFLIC